MDLKVFAFTAPTLGAVREGFASFVPVLADRGATQLREWQVEDIGYLVVTDPGDEVGVADIPDDLPVDLLGAGRAELLGAVEGLPVEIDHHLGFSGISDRPIPGFTLRLCMGCGAELPASRSEHLARHCTLVS